MTEEELKKGCGKELFLGYGKCGQFNLISKTFNYCEGCERELKGFLAGQLSERQRCLKEMNKNFIINILAEDVRIDVEEHMKFIDTENVLKKIGKIIVPEELTQKIKDEVGKE